MDHVKKEWSVVPEAAEPKSGAYEKQGCQQLDPTAISPHALMPLSTCGNSNLSFAQL
ncbi:MAG: hypothetical protein M3Q42_11110 [Pseudomonadota bacterium]|nr:hypothetical protein [Pseudomonadota bacterium]